MNSEERTECWLSVVDHLVQKREIGGVSINRYGKQPNDLFCWIEYLMLHQADIKLSEHDYDLTIKYRDGWPREVIITLIPKV